MKKDILVIILLCFFICLLGLANENPKPVKVKSFIVSGKILDKYNNEHLAGVKIQCHNYNKTVYSDLDGNFFVFLEMVNDDPLMIEFSQVGYETKILDFGATQSSAGNLEVALVTEH